MLAAWRVLPQAGCLVLMGIANLLPSQHLVRALIFTRIRASRRAHDQTTRMEHYVQPNFWV